MGILRVGKSKELLQIHLPGGRAQQIRAPYHLCYPGKAVVHGDRQLIHVYAVGPPDHHIPAVRGKVPPGDSLDPVLYLPDPVRYPHPPGRIPAHGRPLRLAQVPAGAGIDIGAVAQVGGIDAVELAAGAVAGIQQTLVPELLKISIIHPCLPALGRCLPVPGQAQPGKVLPQNPDVFFTGALGIQILHPKNHFTALGFHRQPGNQGREHVAQMHSARGRGGKPPHRGYRIHRYHHQNRAAMPRSSSAMANFRPT